MRFCLVAELRHTRTVHLAGLKEYLGLDIFFPIHDWEEFFSCLNPLARLVPILQAHVSHVFVISCPIGRM